MEFAGTWTIAPAGAAALAGTTPGAAELAGTPRGWKLAALTFAAGTSTAGTSTPSSPVAPPPSHVQPEALKQAKATAASHRRGQ
ncbi:MAG: hypothetical protein DCC68_25210 [Planctomycetota bacterium]|nr:MAG: hypothetical protein DCC68_25210 [Planctomycetota bacterium]